MTFDECLEIAKKFSGPAQWKKTERKSYRTTMFRGWMSEVKVRLNWRRNRCEDTGDNDLVSHAKTCQTRQEWWTKFYHEYAEVMYNRRHLHQQCTAHMGQPCGVEHYQLYVYKFNDESVYVGITREPDFRHKCHLERSGPVKRKIASGIKFELVTVADNLWMWTAARLERRLIRAYKRSKITVMNKTRGGELGSITSKYTYDYIKNLAQGFTSFHSFTSQFGGASNAIHINVWSRRLCDDMGWHLRTFRPMKSISFDECLQTASEFSSCVAWKCQKSKFHHAAKVNGWLNQIKDQLGWKRKLNHLEAVLS